MIFFWIFGLVRRIVFLIAFASILILLFGSRCTALTEGFPDFLPGIGYREDNREMMGEALTAQFRNNMATEFDIEGGAIRIRRVEPTVWMDTCLGVPRSAGCENRITPGFKLEILVNTDTHLVHLDQRGNFVFPPQ